MAGETLQQQRNLQRELARVQLRTNVNAFRAELAAPKGSVPAERFHHLLDGILAGRERMRVTNRYGSNPQADARLIFELTSQAGKRLEDEGRIIAAADILDRGDYFGFASGGYSFTQSAEQDGLLGGTIFIYTRPDGTTFTSA